MLNTLQQMQMSQVLDMLSKPVEMMTGPELRRCRELMGLSVLEVSNKTGISAMMIHEIEAIPPNSIAVGSLATMINQLAELYRIPIQRPTMPWETPPPPPEVKPRPISQRPISPLR